MSEALPQWSLDLLPDDPPLLADLQRLGRAWLSQGLALHPTPDGGLTYYPRLLTAKQKELVRQMAPYKPLLQRLYQAHPALALFTTEVAGPFTVCPACFQLIPMEDGHGRAHQYKKQPCPGVATEEKTA